MIGLMINLPRGDRPGFSRLSIPVARSNISVSLPGIVIVSLVERFVAVTLSTRVVSPVPVKVRYRFCAVTEIEIHIKEEIKISCLMITLVLCVARVLLFIQVLLIDIIDIC